MIDDISKLIGNTPIIKINSLSEELNTNIYAKLEYYNPGMSSKDRPAYFMIKEAIDSGQITEGGTLVEASSGNTGLGVALLAKGNNLNCVIFTTDKISDEKLANLKAQKATVHICPSSVSSTDPLSTISQAKKYSETHENSFFCNQYFNEMNPYSHYKTTGPEIYEQTEGKITHLIAGVGTGGTITGCGKYLKEKNKEIKIIGVDAVGSVITKYFNEGVVDPAEKKSYTIEGVGKGYIPSSLDIQFIDEMIQINDIESIEAARYLCKHEGLLIGYSSGTVVSAIRKMGDRFTPEDHVVTIFPDHGANYISKIYNDKWVAELKAKQSES